MRRALDGKGRMVAMHGDQPASWITHRAWGAGKSNWLEVRTRLFHSLSGRHCVFVASAMTRTAPLPLTPGFCAAKPRIDCLPRCGQRGAECAPCAGVLPGWPVRTVLDWIAVFIAPSMTLFLLRLKACAALSRGAGAFGGVLSGLAKCAERGPTGAALRHRLKRWSRSSRL